MKKNILISFSILIFFIAVFNLFVFRNKNNFDILTQIHFNNVSADEINYNFAKLIKDELLKIQEIEKIILFSRENSCNIYCKINSLTLDKKQIANKIERKLNCIKNKTFADLQICFDDEYYKKYQTFLIVYAKDFKEEELNNICEKISQDLAGLKITTKLLRIGERKKAIYINFDDEALLQYNLSLSDIENIIKNNNIIENSTEKNNQKNLYPLTVNGNIKNISDIKNILIPYKNETFSIKFQDIFDIEEKMKIPPDYYIAFDDCQAQIFALSKKRFYPEFIFKLKLKNYLSKIQNETPKINFKLIKTSKTDKIQIYLNQNSNLSDVLNLYKKINNLVKSENVIYFIGHDIPKISENEVYFENEKNKLTVVSSKKQIRQIKKILKKNNINYINENTKPIILKAKNLNKLQKKIEKINECIMREKFVYATANTGSTRALQISYKIDDYSLIDLKATKKDIINTVFAANEGFVCDYFYQNSKKIPIILKNKNIIKRIFVLNKKEGILTPLNSITKSTVSEKYSVISREDNDFFATIYVDLSNSNIFKRLKLIYEFSDKS